MATIVVLALALVAGLTPLVEVVVTPAAAQDELPEPEALPEIPDPQAANDAAKAAAEQAGGRDDDTKGAEPVGPPSEMDPTLKDQFATDTDGEAYIRPEQEPQPTSTLELVDDPGLPPGPLEGPLLPVDQLDPALRREVEELRTETSRTYDNGDGTYSTEQFLDPVHVENADGSFDPIETDLEGRDGRLHQKRGKVDIFLGDSGADELTTIKPTGDTELGYALEGAADVPAEVDGETARYRSVLPGVDLELESSATSVKETIVLASASSANEFAFKVQGKGMKLRLTAAGQVEWLDRKSGEVLAVVPKGWAVDAAGVRTESVTYSIKGKKLVVTLDDVWLNDPARVFPVKIDPTTVLFETTGDATGIGCPTIVGLTQQENQNRIQISNTNYSGTLDLRTGYDNYFQCYTATNMRFDSILPVTRARVFSANLSMFVAASHPTCVPTAVFVHTIANDWNPATVSWNSSPSVYAAPTASDILARGCDGDPAGWQNFDVTNAVSDWASGAKQNYGLRVGNSSSIGVLNSDPDTFKIWQSTETDFGPRLSIRYSPYRAEVSAVSLLTAPNITTEGLARVTVKNVGGVTWTPGAYKVAYRLFDGAGNNVGLANPPLGSFAADVLYGAPAVNVDVPIQALTPGLYYLEFNVIRTDVYPTIWFGEEGSQPKVLGLSIVSTLPQIENIGPAGSVPTSKPTLSVTAYDPDSWPADALVYDFKWCTDLAMTVGCQSSNNRPEGSIDVGSVGGIQWGTLYYWTVTIRHGSESRTSSPLPLTAVVPQPDLPSHLGGGDIDPGGVSLATGNYTQTIRDLEVEAAGPELAIERTYNSQDPRSGTLFGRGFSSPFDMTFKKEPATDTALVTFPDGHQQRFGNNGATYVGPPGSFDRITSAQTAVTLTTGDGMNFVFNTYKASPDVNDGKLIEIRNVNGQKLLLGWHATTGVLQSITSQPSGRVLTVTMTPTTPAHISSVTTQPVAANNNLPYRMDYTYAGDNLDTVCGPRSATECVDHTFGTDSANAGDFNRLTKVVTAGANKPGADFIASTTAIELTYRPDGSVKVRTDAAGEQTTYSDDRNQLGGLYHPVAPIRIENGVSIANNGSRTVSVAGRAGFPADPREVRAAVLNVTVTGASGNSGFLRAWETGRTEPATSVANYNSAATTADQMVTVPVNDAGTFQLKHFSTGGAGTVHVDLLGWYGEADPTVSGGLSYHPTNLTRIIDTRTPLVGDPYDTVWPANGDREIQIAGHPQLTPQGVPSSKVKAVAVNVQAVSASGNSSMIAYASGTTAPSTVTTMRMWSGRTRTNTVIVPVGDDGKIRLKSLGTPTAHIVVDVYGWFALPDDYGDGSVYQPAVDPKRTFDSRAGTRIGPFTTPWQNNTTRNVAMTGTGLLSSDGVSAINASLVAPTATGDRVLTTWPTDLLAPTGSSVVAPGGLSVGNTVFNRVAGDGSANVTNFGGATDALLDVYGAFYTTSRVTSVRTPLGVDQRYTFDNLRRLIVSEDELNNKTTNKYTAGGQLSSTLDRSGFITTYGYDTYGRVAAIGRSEPCEYWLAGGWGPLFCPWRYEYLAYAPVESVPVGHPAFNKPAATRDPRSASATDETYARHYWYDGSGRLQQQAIPGGHAAGKYTKYTYTNNTYVVGSATLKMPDGLLRTVRRPDNTETRYDYDVKGDLVAEVGPYPVEPVGGASGTPHPELGSSSSHTYDELGRRLTSTTVLDTSVTPAQTATTTFAHDGRGRLTTQTDPAVTDTVNNVLHQARSTTTYDANGNIVEVEVADVGGSPSSDASRTKAVVYDAANRPVRLKAPATADETRTYGAGSLLRTTTQASRTFEYSYSVRGELTATTLKNFVSNPIFAPPAFDLLVEARGYDGAGRVAYTIDAEGRRVDLTYLHQDKIDKAILKDFGPTGQAQRDITLVDNEYDKAGNLTERKTPKANGASADATTQYVWNAQGWLWEERHLTGAGSVTTQGTTYGYDAVGRTTGVTAYGIENSWFSDFETTSITYEHHDQPVSVVVDPDGQGYDGLGLTTTYEYDVAGRQKKSVDPSGADSLTTYDALSRPVTVSSPEVGSQTYAAQTEVNGRAVVRSGYNTFGETIASKDPLNQTTKQVFDGAGRPTETTFPAYTPVAASGLPATPIIPKETTEYDELGRVKATIDRRNQRTDLTLDPLDRLIAVQEPAVGGNRPAWLYWYDNSGDQLRQVDPRGIHTVSEWDDLDRKTRSIVGETVPVAKNLATDFVYDDAGNVTKVTDPTGVTADLVYDNVGQLLETKRPKAAGTGTVSGTTAYDFLGRPYTTTDESGVRIEQRYDAAGRRSSVQRFGADGTPTPAATFGYDVANRLTTAVDPRGFATTAQTDALGRVRATGRVAVTTPIAITNGVGPIAGPELVTESKGYDLAGNLTRETNGRGYSTWNTYNAWGLPDTKVEPSTPTHPSTANRTWAWGYDPGGLPVKEVAPGGVTRTRTFDELSRLTAESGAGAEAATVARSMGYDAVGNVTSYATPGGNATVSYNGRGLPVTVADPQVTTAYTYDDGGRTTKISGGPDAVNFTYNGRGELQTEKHQNTPETATWTYRDDGKPSSRSFGSGATTQSWTYDTFGRLETSTLANGASVLRSDTYGYDDNDNIVSKAIGPATVPGAGSSSYTYDGMNRLRSWTNPASAVTTYGWDAASNRTTAGATTAVYDERNRLTSSTTGATTTNYTWSARGTLASTKVGAAATQTHQFDAFDRILNDAGTVYAYDSLDRVRSRNGAVLKWEGLTQNLIAEGSQQFTYDPAGRPLRQYSGSTNKELLSDAHGDVVGSHTPTSTSLTTAKAFDPFGQVIGSSGTTPPSLGYQGDWTDPTTGRVDANARFYTPATGTFASRDSVDDPLMSNRYGYTPANPLKFNDFDGHRAGGGMGGFRELPPGIIASLPVWVGACIASTACVFGAVVLIAVIPAIIYAIWGADVPGGCGLYLLLTAPLVAAFCGLGWELPIPEDWLNDESPSSLPQAPPGEQIIPAGPATPIRVDACDVIGCFLPAGPAVPVGGDLCAFFGGCYDPGSGPVPRGQTPVGEPDPWPDPTGTIYARPPHLVERTGPRYDGTVIGTDTDGAAGDPDWRDDLSAIPVIVVGETGDQGARVVETSEVSSRGLDGGGAAPCATEPTSGQPPDVYHVTADAKSAQDVVDGINPAFLSPESRFGPALYSSEVPETALAEAQHHGKAPDFGIRYSVDDSNARILDLTDPSTAAEYGYAGGPITPSSQAIATLALSLGYNAIRFLSERGSGANLAVIDDHNDVLHPQMITPTTC